jgi:exodeoxyribonuclease VII small subunit
MENNLTYEAAFDELQQIASAIENETITVDQLADKLKRSAMLINFCQSRLRSTETEVGKIINQIDQDN